MSARSRRFEAVTTVPAFILGAGLNALGVARSLGRHGIPVVVCHSFIRDIADRSRYVTPIILDEDARLALGALLTHAQAFAQRPVLFATSDQYVRLVSEYRNVLAQRFRFLIPEEGVIETVTDKSKFAAFAREHQWPIPATFIPTTEDEVRRNAEQLRYPLVIKPALSYEWSRSKVVKERFRIGKIVRVETPAELIGKWNDLKDTSRALVIQEWIPGGDDQLFHYYSYRSSHDKETIGDLVSQRLRIYPIHGGVGTFVRATSDAELASISRVVLSELRFVGASTVCFKRDAVTKEYKIVEINGRLPQAHSLFQMCGIDLPYIMYKDLLGHVEPIPQLRNLGNKWVSIQLDAPAVWSYWRAGELTLPSWLASLRGTKMCAEFAWDDWKPFFFAVQALAQRMWGRLRRRS